MEFYLNYLLFLVAFVGLYSRRKGEDYFTFNKKKSKIGSSHTCSTITWILSIFLQIINGVFLLLVGCIIKEDFMGFNYMVFFLVGRYD